MFRRDNVQQYQQLVREVLEHGHKKEDRTGVGTLSLFGHQMRFDLKKGFPMVTTKRVPFGLIKSELLWFLKGDTNIRYLLQHNNHIWDEWAFENYVKSNDYTGPNMEQFGIRVLEDEAFKSCYEKEMNKFQEQILNDDLFAKKHGDLGDIYGKQWRKWELRNGDTLDQIQWVINEIKTNPNSRRLIVTAWNPEDIPKMALPPCHSFYQFYVHNNQLSCQLYQRSADIFLGVPFNIASYALLVHLIAKECGLEVGEFIHTIGDAHLYLNHIVQANELLTRQPKESPTLVIHGDKTLDHIEFNDIELVGYRPHRTIQAPIAV